MARLASFRLVFGVLLAALTLGGCATAQRTNVLTRAQIDQLKITAITVDTGKLSLMDISDQPRQADIGPKVKAKLDAAFASRLSPTGNARLHVKLIRIDIPDGTAASFGFGGGPLEGLTELYLDDAKTPTAVYPVTAFIRGGGINGSTVNGIPVGLIAQTLIVAATRPDGLEALADVFAADTLRAVTTE